MPNPNKLQITAKVAEYAIPPLKDMLVLGKQAPIGCIAMRKAIELLVKAPFAHLEIEDDCISDVLVREQLLKRIDKNHLLAFVLDEIKPIMGADEILQVELDVSIFLSYGGS